MEPERQEVIRLQVVVPANRIQLELKTTFQGALYMALWKVVLLHTSGKDVVLTMVTLTLRICKCTDHCFAG